MKKGLKILVLTISFIVMISVIGIMLGKLMDNPQLTESEAKVRVEKVYSGEIKTVQPKGNGYSITFEKNNGIYQVFINKTTGKFSDLAVIKKANNEKENNTQQKEGTATQPNSNAESIYSKKNGPSEQTQLLLTDNQVIDIALKEFQGKVEDVDFVQEADGGYYLVEIENNEEEVELQIHAVTGKILSVKFDD